jgi:hypothetical protein
MTSLSPNLRRYLPFMLVAFLLLVLLPTLFKKSTTASASSPSVQSADTINALTLVDRSERAYHAAHGRYTPNVADILITSHALGADLTDGVIVQLNVNSTGNAYYALVQSPVLALLRARDGSRIATESCTIVKSESGVACPVAATAPHASSSK